MHLTRYKNNAVQATIPPSASQSTSQSKATAVPSEKPKATTVPATAAPATAAPAPATAAPVVSAE